MLENTVSYLTVSTDYFLIATSNDTDSPQLTTVFEEHFDMKVLEGSILTNTNFRICRSLLGFIVDQTDHIMELIN